MYTLSDFAVVSRDNRTGEVFTRIYRAHDALDANGQAAYDSMVGKRNGHAVKPAEVGDITTMDVIELPAAGTKVKLQGFTFTVVRNHADAPYPVTTIRHPSGIEERIPTENLTVI